ncbi:MAG: hypothetical protein ACYC27_11680 [Armatimonadota bacterium]
MKNYKPDSLEYMLYAGRGKAILDLLGKDLSGYRNMILDYCTHRRAYDRQLEGSRADYLYPLIQKSGDSDFYCAEILKALNDADEMFDAEQLFDFSVLFFRDGYAKAGDAVIDKFNRQDTIKDFNSLVGAEHVVDIKGINGLIHVLDYVGSKPDLLDFHANTYLIHYAEDIFGEELICQSLGAARKENCNVNRFLDCISDSYTTSLVLDDIIRVNEGKSQISDRFGYIEGMTWEQIKQSDGHFPIRSWVESATDCEIEFAARDILLEQDPEKLAWYLQIFWKRAYPFHPAPLIQMLDSSNSKLSISAFNVLSQINHPDIRALFDRLIQNREWAASAIRLLVNNYQDGDHIIIEKLLEHETDVHKLDKMVFWVCNVFKCINVPESLRSLMLVYEKSPCSLCRYKSVKLMDALGQLPAWIIDECVYDADEDLRALAHERSDISI